MQDELKTKRFDFRRRRPGPTEILQAKVSGRGLNACSHAADFRNYRGAAQIAESCRIGEMMRRKS